VRDAWLEQVEYIYLSIDDGYLVLNCVVDLHFPSSSMSINYDPIRYSNVKRYHAMLCLTSEDAMMPSSYSSIDILDDHPAHL
jgi:hypothetical protein